jgi:hypothetical protein
MPSITAVGSNGSDWLGGPRAGAVAGRSTRCAFACGRRVGGRRRLGTACACVVYRGVSGREGGGPRAQQPAVRRLPAEALVDADAVAARLAGQELGLIAHDRDAERRCSAPRRW